MDTEDLIDKILETDADMNDSENEEETCQEKKTSVSQSPWTQA